MKAKAIITVLLLQLAMSVSAAGFTDDIVMSWRLGLNVGGTMPLSMPVSIRALNAYSPLVNPQFAATVEKRFSQRLGVEGGLRLERKAMRTDAQVKTYHMTMTQGDESIEGVFTGGVITRCSTWGMTVPVQLACYFGDDFKLRVGPMVSLLFNKDFSGYAYDGYLRKNTPTGQRIEIGHSPEERGNYDFGNDMRNVQFAMGVGADWNFSSNYGLYVDLQCGLNGAFKSSFKTIEQTMHPIYCTIGVFKQIR